MDKETQVGAQPNLIFILIFFGRASYRKSDLNIEPLKR